MTTQEKRVEALKGAREKKAANKRDKDDRAKIEERLRALVAKERPDVDPSDVEFTFIGDLSDVVIFIPDKKLGNKVKIGHKLKEGT
jgi:hypothetical protein